MLKKVKKAGIALGATGKQFLADNDGLEMVEYLAGGAIAIALLAIAIWAIATSANGEGQSVGTYIDGINAPASP